MQTSKKALFGLEEYCVVSGLGDDSAGFGQMRQVLLYFIFGKTQAVTDILQPAGPASEHIENTPVRFYAVSSSSGKIGYDLGIRPESRGNSPQPVRMNANNGLISTGPDGGIKLNLVRTYQQNSGTNFLHLTVACIYTLTKEDLKEAQRRIRNAN